MDKRDWPVSCAPDKTEWQEGDVGGDPVGLRDRCRASRVVVRGLLTRVFLRSNFRGRPVNSLLIRHGRVSRCNETLLQDRRPGAGRASARTRDRSADFTSPRRATSRVSSHSFTCVTGTRAGLLRRSPGHGKHDVGNCWRYLFYRFRTADWTARQSTPRYCHYNYFCTSSRYCA